MELADRTRRGEPCTFERLPQIMDPDDWTKVEGWLAQPRTVIQHAQIARSLTAAGHKVSGDTVGRHRRGDCKCGDL